MMDSKRCLVMKRLFKLLLKLLRKPKRIEGNNKFICNVQKDPIDKRDHYYIAKVSTIPISYSLKEFCPPVKNQGSIGSCSAHAYATSMEVMYKKHKPDWYEELSERFNYYTVRDSEYMNTLPQDSGAFLRENAKVLNKIGICSEKLCPYDINRYNETPSIFAYSMARFWKAKEYHRITSIEDMKKALTEGKPIVVGTYVYDSFINQIGEQMSPNQTGTNRGGHAYVVIGFDDQKQSFEIMNSWGILWGNKGFCWIPYQFFNLYMFDAWAMDILEGDLG